MLETAKLSLLVFSILVSIGGVVGFLKAKSKMSLIAGILSGALLATSYSISLRNAQVGFMLGNTIVIVLAAIFLIRLRKTGKFMPAGLMLVLCALELLLLAFATR